jgi:hypothetical protein
MRVRSSFSKPYIKIKSSHLLSINLRSGCSFISYTMEFKTFIKAMKIGERPFNKNIDILNAIFRRS